MQCGKWRIIEILKTHQEMQLLSVVFCVGVNLIVISLLFPCDFFYTDRLHKICFIKSITHLTKKFIMYIGHSEHKSLCYI